MAFSLRTQYTTSEAQKENYNKRETLASWLQSLLLSKIERVVSAAVKNISPVLVRQAKRE